MPTKSEQIQRCLLENIHNGRYGVGQSIPSRARLMAEFNCSRTPVEDAISTLMEQGFLAGRQGSHTYVCSLEPTRAIRELLVVTGNDSKYSGIVFSELILNQEALGIPIRWFTPQKVLEAPDKLVAPGVGVVWTFPNPTDIWVLDYLKQHRIPVLLLNRNYADFDSVCTDTFSSIKEGLTWLQIETGREIAIVSRRPAWQRPFEQERLLATFQITAIHNTHITENRIAIEHFRNVPEEMPEVCRRFFKGEQPPRGIFILDSDLAMPFTVCARSLNLVPKRDYSLLVFDYLPEMKGISGVAMLRQQYSLFPKEIQRWVVADHSQPFNVTVKAELVIS